MARNAMWSGPSRDDLNLSKIAVGVIFSVGQTDITHFYTIVSVCHLNIANG